MEPEWVVNTLGELGVKIGDRLFFLYKGRNIEYDSDTLDSEGRPIQWRYVGKREFGETCQPHRLHEWRDEFENCLRQSNGPLPDWTPEEAWLEEVNQRLAEQRENYSIWTPVNEWQSLPDANQGVEE